MNCSELKTKVLISVLLLGLGLCIDSTFVWAAKKLSSSNQASDGVVGSKGHLSLPKVEYLWVSPSGEVTRNLWKKNARWVWVEDAQYPGFSRPVLKTDFELPVGQKVVAIQSDTLTWEGEQAESGNKGFLPTGQISLELDRSKGSAVVVIENSQTRERTEVGIVIRSARTEPILWTHSGCKRFGIEAKRVESLQQDALFSSAYCRDQGDEVEVLIASSSDATVSNIRSLLGPKVPAITGQLLSFKKADLRKSGPAVLAEWGVREFDGSDQQQSGLAESRYSLSLLKKLDPAIRSSGGYFAAGTGFTYMDYSETRTESGESNRFGVGETAMTVKVGGGLRLRDGKWDINGGGFLNAIAFSPSYSATPADLLTDSELPNWKCPARYMGANARVSYRLTSVDSPWEWRVAGGSYLWGMNLPEECRSTNDQGQTVGNYGVKYLLGPQVFLSLRSYHRKNRNWGAYAKYALTGAAVSSFDSKNMEVSFGADYQLFAWNKRPISLTMDLAQVGMASSATAGASQEFTLRSISLGLQGSL